MKKTVYITGASRGIGYAAAMKFAQNGYNVVACASSPSEKALKSFEAIKTLSPDSLLLTYDVKNALESKQAVCQAVEKFGKIDALVLSAGIAYSELFQYTDEQSYDLVMNTNVKGSFLTAKYLLPHMIKEKNGSIVFVSSMWGQVGASMESIYSASKGAVISMSKALAKEVGPSGIRVNCLAPGVIETDMTAVLGKDTLDALADETPLMRNGTPEDAANAIYYLTSDEASFITGQVLSVNGGFTVV